MRPSAPAVIKLNKKFLENHADVSLVLSPPPALLTAIQEGKAMPSGEFTLGDIKASAGGDGKVTFGGGDTKGKVTFGGHAEASFSLGVFADPANAVKAIAPSLELSKGLNLADSDLTRYLVLRAAYNVDATAKGSLALGTGASGNFGVTGASSGLFAVLHRFDDSEKTALQVFEDTFSSWALPRQIGDKDDLKPGTWIIAEVDGSIAITMGVQAGYDFSWIREINDATLKGDIGLRIQLGASAAFGFDASGKYAVVLGREGNDAVFRLRLFKMAKKGWGFAASASVGIQATLPESLQKTRPEELVAAVFGLNKSQLLEDLTQVRSFVNSNVSLKDKLAGLLMQLGGKAIEESTGLSQDEVKAIFEKGRERVLELMGKLENLTKNAGHDVTSLLLSFTGQDFSKLEEALKRIVAAGSSDDQLKAVLKEFLNRAGFERTPIGRLVDALPGSALAALTDSDAAKQLRLVAQQTLDIISGKTLQEVIDFIEAKVHLDKVKAVITQNDFDKLDSWLKARLADFLGKQEALMADLQKIQDGIKRIFEAADKFTEMALSVARKKHEFSWAATYSRSTTRTALIDITFDLAKPGTMEIMKGAINGDFANLLLNEIDGVSIGEAELTHSIKRNVSSELTFPFGSSRSASQTVSSARLRIVEDDGRVLVYTVEAEDEKEERRRLFGARSGRDSTLTIAATMPLGVGGVVKVWKESTFTYAYEMKRAVVRMRVSQMQEEIGPLVSTYLPSSFSSDHSFPEWVADLDKLLDLKDPNSGTHDIGDTLVALTLSAPSAYLRAWNKSPADDKDPTYMQLSVSLQAELRRIITFFYFSDPSRYADLFSAAPAVVYSCLPLTTSIRLNSDGDVERFNTNRELYWDQVDPRELRAMVTSEKTRDRLGVRMTAIAAMLRGIPDLANTARFYDFNQINFNNIIKDALRKNSASSTRPELLASLVDVEARLVQNAAAAGLKMAQFRVNSAKEPAKALQKLAEFGEDLTSTFNSQFAGSPFLAGAARPLGTLLFAEAARAFEPALANDKLTAMLNIKVIQSGKLSIDDMLAGKITPQLLLHEQPFVEA
jgi:hypothetical protein